MILFKACPRCGGDVDVTYRDDVYCVQCAYRPPLAVSPGLRAAGRHREQTRVEAPEQTEGQGLCARCSSAQLVQLDRLRPDDHTCYRCRACGHIFSPRPNDGLGYSDAVQH